MLAFPGVDRIILHNPGANDTFCADDLPMDVIRESALFHFGYPPHMKRMFENEGAELIRMMRLVREAGTVTSLDMSMVDPKSEAGQVDWRSVLEKTLPYVDIFAPSVEELTFMLDRDAYRKIKAKSSDADFTELLDIEADVEPLGSLAQKSSSSNAVPRASITAQRVNSCCGRSGRRPGLMRRSGRTGKALSKALCLTGFCPASVREIPASRHFSRLSSKAALWKKAFSMLRPQAPAAWLHMMR